MDYRERSIYVPFQAKFYQFRTKQIIDRSNEEYFMVCIPDGCLDIVFIQKDGIIRIELIGTPVECKQLIVYPDAEYFGVRMQPGLILPNAEISLREAADSEIFLPQLSPDYRELSEKSLRRRISLRGSGCLKNFSWPTTTGISPSRARSAARCCC